MKQNRVDLQRERRINEVLKFQLLSKADKSANFLLLKIYLFKNRKKIISCL